MWTVIRKVGPVKAVKADTKMSEIKGVGHADGWRRIKEAWAIIDESKNISKNDYHEV